MTGRNTNIYFPEEIYNKLRQVAGQKISRFVSEAVEEKLQKTEQEKKDELRQRLIVGYQRRAKNKKLQEELRVMGEASASDVFNLLEKKENESSN